MGSTYIIDRDKDSTTLIHELTHQLMSPQAKQASWFCEGSAEYVAMTPYAGGRFNFGANRSHIVSRVTEYGKKNTGGRALGDDFEAPGLEAFMNMPYTQFTSENANLHYGLAALMAYYFYHMDGKGDAQRIKNYMKAIQSGTSEKEAQKLFWTAGPTRNWPRRSSKNGARRASRSASAPLPDHFLSIQSACSLSGTGDTRALKNR